MDMHKCTVRALPVIGGFVALAAAIALLARAQSALPAPGDLTSSAARPASSDPHHWTHFVRIAGYGLTPNNADMIVRDASASHVFGIETDNDIPGRYESFLDPTTKLAAIKAVAERAHEARNYAYVYIAGLECITANAAQVAHTMFKDHPSWLQRNREGQPAIFGGGTAFWIRPGDEDVWVSPYAEPWRQIYMQRVRQIAATGIDGIYVDIPYWMTHFTGWEKSWSSFDDFTVAAFKAQTGLDARRDFRLDDFNDPNFVRWVDFRINTITDFMRDIDRNAKAVNPNCMAIAEIYPGIEESATVVGADVYSLYPVVDAIAHEYEYGHGDHMAAARTPLDWFNYMAGMYSFRAFAEGKASWILNYSWDGNRGVGPAKPMENLALGELMAGANFWDARGHVMSGSNDIATRRRIFAWIAAHEQVLYQPRLPMHPVGVYFSPKTRDYFPGEFIPGYRGALELLMQSHIEFQIVTPRTLANFDGPLLILPNVKSLDNNEVDLLRRRIAAGKGLMITGETGSYDEHRRPRATNPLLALLHDEGAAQNTNATQLMYAPARPELQYYRALEDEFNRFAENHAKVRSVPGAGGVGRFEELRRSFAARVRRFIADAPVKVNASPFVATQIALVDGSPHVFLANFRGLTPNAVADPTPESRIRVSFRAKPNAHIYMLPFLGAVQELQSSRSAGRVSATLPAVSRGAIVWCASKTVRTAQR